METRRKDLYGGTLPSADLARLRMHPLKLRAARVPSFLIKVPVSSVSSCPLLKAPDCNAVPPLFAIAVHLSGCPALIAWRRQATCCDRNGSQVYAERLRLATAAPSTTHLIFVHIRATDRAALLLRYAQRSPDASRWPSLCLGSSSGAARQLFPCSFTATTKFGIHT
jgi:hypothetical protein